MIVKDLLYRLIRALIKERKITWVDEIRKLTDASQRELKKSKKKREDEERERRLEKELEKRKKCRDFVEEDLPRIQEDIKDRASCGYQEVELYGRYNLECHEYIAERLREENGLYARAETRCDWYEYHDDGVTSQHPTNRRDVVVVSWERRSSLLEIIWAGVLYFLRKIK